MSALAHDTPKRLGRIRSEIAGNIVWFGITPEGDSLLSEAGDGRNQFGMVLINHAELLRKLHRRGKTPSSLRAAKVASFDTLAKIAKGKRVQAEVLQRITAQLAEWPELEHAADLLEQPA